MDKHATLIFYTGAFHLSKPICPARQPPSVVPLSWMPLLFLLCGRRRRIPPKIRASVCLRECEWCARYSALRYVHFILFRRLLLHFFYQLLHGKNFRKQGYTGARNSQELCGVVPTRGFTLYFFSSFCFVYCAGWLHEAYRSLS